jgi:Xaa-Pro aminopeptidase
MRKALIDPNVTVKRRKALEERAEKDSAFVLFSGSQVTRNNDAGYRFRVNSDFFYLTGYEEAESIVIIRPGKTPNTIVFVPKKDPAFETWEGFLFGPEGAKEEFKFDEAYTNDEFLEKAPELLSEATSIYYRLGLNESNDRKMFNVLNKILRSKGRKGSPLSRVLDPEEVLGPMRRIKDDTEKELMRKSAQIAAKSHVKAMRSIKPGMNERQIEGVFIGEALSMNAQTTSYVSICAGGDNATTLHYNFNDEELKDGDLFLIDAGAEYCYYASDITRTYPINGKFTEPQKELYEAVLKVQKDMIKRIKPGVSFTELNDLANKQLTQIMVDKGLLSGDVDELIKSNEFRKYYPHSLGHYLGMDVHDTGPYIEGHESKKFEEGVVITIEPGIYIPRKDTAAPEQYRGIGIRIEDDILVTKTGCEVLTLDVPKEISELEDLIGHS